MNAARAEEKFLTRDEVRKILRFSLLKLDEEIRAGRLRTYRFGRLVRISASDLGEYIQSAKEPAK